MSITDEKLSEKFEVATIPEEPDVEIVVASTEDSDHEKARKTLSGLIDSGETAVAGILNIADSTESPRAYEVAGQLIKAVSEVAKDLVAIQKQKEKGGTQIGKQTNVFVGSTKDLLRAMREEQAELEVPPSNG